MSPALNPRGLDNTPVTCVSQRTLGTTEGQGERCLVPRARQTRLWAGQGQFSRKWCSFL